MDKNLPQGLFKFVNQRQERLIKPIMAQSFHHHLYHVQSGFMRLLSIGKIPLILLLSLASGYTTYHGMKLFITDWIALIITLAVQTIIVIATVELAKTHWRASLLKFLSIVTYLVIALAVSIFFSYFKFYEISETVAIKESKYTLIKDTTDRYLDDVLVVKGQMIEQQMNSVKQANATADLAYFGAHPDMPSKIKGRVGKGKYWKYYNEVVQRETLSMETLQTRFDALTGQINEFSEEFSKLDMTDLESKSKYLDILGKYENIGTAADSIFSDFGRSVIRQPSIMTHERYLEVKPSLNILAQLSPLALTLAMMVDIFTLILSYRLEASPPEQLTDDETRLAFLGLREFPDWKINGHDQLETDLEKSSHEIGEDYNDSWRKLVVGMLLNRGLLRKVSSDRIEFAPQLYSLIIDQLVNDMGGVSQPAGGVSSPIESSEAELEN